MKVLLFEWLTGGGLWENPGGLKSASQLLGQGIAMVSAVGNDLATIVEVDLLVDSRLISTNKLGKLIEIVDAHSVGSHAGLKSKLQSLAKSADAILLIAPETDACLAEAIGWLGNEHHKLISPSLDFVTATSNKNQLADRLIQHGFNEIPNGTDLESFLNLSAEQRVAWFPVVVKPADGVGSEGVEYFEDSAEFSGWLLQNSAHQSADFRAEQFASGIPASIAVICRGDQEPVFFPAMKQVLHPPPVGEYLRSEDCLTDSQQLRAKRLAASAIDCLPHTTGFIGLDIVLSNEQDNSTPANDVLIEINPRITMSYIPLSQKLGLGQIAKMMLEGFDY